MPMICKTLLTPTHSSPTAQGSTGACSLPVKVEFFVTVALCVAVAAAKPSLVALRVAVASADAFPLAVALPNPDAWATAVFVAEAVLLLPVTI